MTFLACKSASVNQGNGGVAIACSLAVTGYKQDPQNPAICDVVGPVEVGFNPDDEGAQLGSIESNMAEADFNSLNFKGLTNVTMTVATSAVGVNNLTILAFDDFEYTTYEYCCD